MSDVLSFQGTQGEIHRFGVELSKASQFDCQPGDVVTYKLSTQNGAAMPAFFAKLPDGVPHTYISADQCVAVVRAEGAAAGQQVPATLHAPIGLILHTSSTAKLTCTVTRKSTVVKREWSLAVGVGNPWEGENPNTLAPWRPTLPHGL